MTISVLQSAVAANPHSSSANAVFGSALTVGSKLVAMGANRDSAGTCVVSGLTEAQHTHTSGWPCAWLLWRDVVGGDGTSWNVSSNNRVRVIILEVAGLVAGAPTAVDGAISFGGGAQNAPTMTSGGFIACAFGGDTMTTPTANNGFTLVGDGQVADNLQPRVTGSYKIASGSQTPSVTWPDASNRAAAEGTWAEAAAASRSFGVII